MTEGYIDGIQIDDLAQLQRSSVPDSLRASCHLVRHLRAQNGDDFQSLLLKDLERTSRELSDFNWNDDDRTSAAVEWLFGEQWVDAGCQIYSLSHSIAAMLSVTKAPPVDFSHAPHRAFLISVPSEFLPANSAIERSTRWIGVISSKPNSIILIPDQDTSSHVAFADDGKELSEVTIPDTEQAHGLRTAVRLAANTIAFVSAHRECVTSSPRTAAGNVTHSISAPRDVVIDRAFRDRAKQLVQSRDFKGAKRALAHMVRGHWRNQACGPHRSERRLQWIRPFIRGDESLGRVIQRINRIEAAQ